MKYFLMSCALVAGFAVQAQDYPEQVTHFPGDLSNDSVVGTDDLILLLSLWERDYSEILACYDEVVIDYEGYEYELVAIGDQCWFAENLRTEHYTNGDGIPGNLSDSEWTSTSFGAQAVFGEGASTVVDGSDDEVANLTTYGRLYNWYAVDEARGLCPSGWHVPTDGEWTELTNFLDGVFVAGNAMKSSPLDTPSWDGTNASGFSALPGGTRSDSDGSFYYEGVYCPWWSASPNGTSSAGYRLLVSDIDWVLQGSLNFQGGLAVRCIRD